MERLILKPQPPLPNGVPRLIHCSLNPDDIQITRDASLVARATPLFGSDRPSLGYGREAVTVLTLNLLVEGREEPRPGDRPPSSTMFESGPSRFIALPSAVGHRWIDPAWSTSSGERTGRFVGPSPVWQSGWTRLPARALPRGPDAAGGPGQADPAPRRTCRFDGGGQLMTGWSDLSLSIDGAAVTDQALVGLRLSRRLNAPAELSLAFSGHAAPKGVEVSLQNGSARLFQGEICRTVRRLDQDGPVVEIMARDRLARLSANRQRGSTEHRSILGAFRAAAARCGLEFAASDVTDFAIGRHMVLQTDDLAHVAGLAHRYGIGFAVTDKSLIVTDLVVPPKKGIELGHHTGA